MFLLVILVNTRSTFILRMVPEDVLPRCKLSCGRPL